ncbi:MAG: hypothetical protein AAFS10_16690, partial [Myxococcota bacterium]
MNRYITHPKRSHGSSQGYSCAPLAQHSGPWHGLKAHDKAPNDDGRLQPQRADHILRLRHGHGWGSWQSNLGFVACVGLGMLLFGATALPWSAAASPLFELAGDTMGNGGHSARATGAGAASTYFNPALLPRAQQGFGLGMLVLSDQISMTLDGRLGGDVPVRIGEDRNIRDSSGNLIPNDTIPTEWLENGCMTGGCDPPFAPRPRQGDGSSGNTRSYVTIGLVSPLIGEKLVLGLHAIVPVGEFTTAQQFHVDHREQFFSNSL